MYFFTSDTHFGSEDTLVRENRPFKNHKEFDKYVISLWNKQANKKDIIYHLGDFLNYNSKDELSWEKSLTYVKKIKAKVILIIGGNEQRVIDKHFNGNFESFRKFCIKLGFYDVKIDCELKIAKQKFYLNHHPRNHKKDYINLFGHTHRTTGLWKPYGLNVGCDLNHFFLYSEDEIFRILTLKNKWWDNDVDNLDNVRERKQLLKYRDYFLADNINNFEFIGFYPREFFCFDNFSAFKVKYEGVLFSTVEHAYQAYKFKDTAPDVFNEIVESYSSDEAKRIADRNKDKICSNWNEIKVDLMERLLRAKISQNPYVKEKLIQSKNYIICEDSDKDSFWGIGAKRDGQNQLGKLWMKLRSELLENTNETKTLK